MNSTDWTGFFECFYLVTVWWLGVGVFVFWVVVYLIFLVGGKCCCVIGVLLDFLRKNLSLDR